MGTWDRIVAALRREKRDVDEALNEFKDRANSALDRREREMNATPIEKLEMEEERGREIDDEMEAIRKRIEGGSPDS